MLSAFLTKGAKPNGEGCNDSFHGADNPQSSEICLKSQWRPAWDKKVVSPSGPLLWAIGSLGTPSLIPLSHFYPTPATKICPVSTAHTSPPEFCFMGGACLPSASPGRAGRGWKEKVRRQGHPPHSAHSPTSSSQVHAPPNPGLPPPPSS